MEKKTNYCPEIIADTRNMSETEWHEYRRKGIGGSEAAAVLGLSPFCTARDVYYEKIGVKPATKDEQNWVAKQVGHRLESLVAEIFAVKTSLRVGKGNDMYCHPEYLFMLANIDYFVDMADGTRAILECKTSNVNSRDKWADGAIPVNYEMQVRHYMAVMNIDTAFIACLFGNSDNDFVYCRIDRDYDYEQDIIEQERYFWEEYVQKKTEPPYTESGDLAIESLRKYYVGANLYAPAVTLSENLADTIERYLELRSQKLEFDHKSQDTDNEMKRLSAEIINLMGETCTAVCKSGANEYSIAYKPSYREGINKDSLTALKVFHPEIYSQYASTTENRRFSVTRKEIA